MNAIKLISISSVVALSACSVSMDEANSANYGAKPENNEQQVISLIKGNLKDPDSLKVLSITNPVRAFAKYGFGSTEHGWFTTITYNAKNSYGGYAGATSRNFVYLNGQYTWANPLANGERVLLDKVTYSCKDNCPNG